MCKKKYISIVRCLRVGQLLRSRPMDLCACRRASTSQAHKSIADILPFPCAGTPRIRKMRAAPPCILLMWGVSAMNCFAVHTPFEKQTDARFDVQARPRASVYFSPAHGNVRHYLKCPTHHSQSHPASRYVHAALLHALCSCVWGNCFAAAQWIYLPVDVQARHRRINPLRALSSGFYFKLLLLSYRFPLQ